MQPTEQAANSNNNRQETGTRERREGPRKNLADLARLARWYQKQHESNQCQKLWQKLNEKVESLEEQLGQARMANESLNRNNFHLRVINELEDTKNSKLRANISELEDQNRSLIKKVVALEKEVRKLERNNAHPMINSAPQP